jgi:polyhydroxyalkanoate synthesis regulator phasin
MLEFFERGFLATVGVFTMTKERSQELVDEMIRRGELNRDESKQMVDKLVRRGQEEQEKLRQLVRQEVSVAIRELNLATKEDVEALKEKLDKLLSK